MTFIFGMVVGVVILLIGLFFGAALYAAGKQRQEKRSHDCEEGYKFDQETLGKVYDALSDVGMTRKWAGEAIDKMQNRGILFREAAKN